MTRNIPPSPVILQAILNSEWVVAIVAGSAAPLVTRSGQSQQGVAGVVAMPDLERLFQELREVVSSSVNGWPAGNASDQRPSHGFVKTPEESRSEPLMLQRFDIRSVPAFLHDHGGRSENLFRTNGKQ